MDKKLEILLIEDDKVECQSIIKYIDTTDDVCLTGVTNNTNKALEYVQDKLPDAIILDLELHEGSGNGLSFLKSLNELELKIMPYILITTNNISQITYSHARKLGADFIMGKYQKDYSAKTVIEFLRSMKDTLHKESKKHNISIDVNATESLEQMSKRISQKICANLDNVGISPKMVGRKYLSDAIQITIEKPQKNIYGVLAQKYKKSDSSVQRAMQNAINSTWRSNDIEDLSRFYTARINPEKGVPTIMEFIYHYADKIKNEY